MSGLLSHAHNRFGEHIVKLCRNLSGRLAALGIAITQTGISKIENQDRYVMDYEAAALARALKVTVASLYGE